LYAQKYNQARWKLRGLSPVLTVLPLQLPAYHIAVIMMLVAPEGLWGILHRRFGLELFPARRRMPPAVADGQRVTVEENPD